MQKVAADTRNAAKPVAAASAAAALRADTTMKKTKKLINIRQAFFVPSGFFFFFLAWGIFFSTELTIITMISVLGVQAPMYKNPSP